MTQDDKTCKGKTKRNSPCQVRVVNYDYCHRHRDQSPDNDVEPGDTLNERQRLFIEFFFANGFNRSKAARQAGYSAKSAKRIACNLMAHPKIKAVVEDRLENYAASANETLARLSEFSRATIDHFVDEHGDLELDSEQAKAHRHIIQEIKYDKHGRPESVKIIDPKDAVKSLVKVHGLAVDRVEHSGSVEHRQQPQYDLSVLDDDELEALERITRKLESAQDEENTDISG